MATTAIQKPTLKFLKDLSKNNNREWFTENKPKWKEAQLNLKQFLADLETEMSKFDEIDKTKLFRIYRDVRFSKDKTPYNIHYSMSLSRAGAERRGGYYFRIDTEKIYVGAGFWNPEPKDLKLIRNHIAQEPKEFRKVISNKKIKEVYGPMQGDQVKTSPKGWDKDHPDIDLLRHKQFLFFKNLKLSEATSPTLVKEVAANFKAIQPFFKHMSYILTHDLNGVSLIN